MESTFQILLNLPDICVLQVTKTSRGEWIIRLESTLTSATCRRCGQAIDDFHSLGQLLRLRHLPIFDQAVFLELRPKRFRCLSCDSQPTSTQQLDWYEERSPNTKAYEQMALRLLINSTLADTARKLSVTQESIEGILDRHIATEVEWAEYETLPLIGIDEIALKKGHRDFVAVITTPVEEGGVGILAVLKDRKKETVKSFFRTMPERLRGSIERVCTDLHEGFVRAVEEEVPEAKVVADRFHVAKGYGECADKARKQEMGKLKKQMTKAEYEPLKGAMWPFRKRPEELTSEEGELLERVFAQSPVLRQVYEAREKVRSIFERELSKSGAQCALRAWIKEVKGEGLSYFDSFVTTLERWMDEITNYFLDRESSGFVEGFNNRIKVLKRRCYGIFKVGRIFQRLYLDVEGYELFGLT